MTSQLHLERQDQEIVREALAYVSRRVYDEHGSGVIGELEDRLDELLLNSSGPAPGTIVMTGEHLRALRSALETYCEALDHPSTHGSNRARIAHMRRIISRAEAQGRLPRKLWDRVRGRGKGRK
jgi:hypothetical protein